MRVFQASESGGMATITTPAMMSVMATAVFMIDPQFR